MSMEEILEDLRDCPTTEETLAEIEAMEPLFTPEELIVNNFVINLQLIMNKKKIKQADIARKFNISRQLVSRHLEGLSNMTTKTMVKLANAVDCDVSINIKQKRNKYEKEIK